MKNAKKNADAMQVKKPTGQPSGTKKWAADNNKGRKANWKKPNG